MYPCIVVSLVMSVKSTQKSRSVYFCPFRLVSAEGRVAGDGRRGEERERLTAGECLEFKSRNVLFCPFWLRRLWKAGWQWRQKRRGEKETQCKRVCWIQVKKCIFPPCPFWLRCLWRAGWRGRQKRRGKKETQCKTVCWEFKSRTVLSPPVHSVLGVCGGRGGGDGRRGREERFSAGESVEFKTTERCNFEKMFERHQAYRSIGSSRFHEM